MSARGKVWVAFAIIILITVLAGLASWPKGPDLNLDVLHVPFERELKVHLGLDLSGGTQLTYEADLSKIDATDKTDSMTGVKDVIERRVDAFGVSEPKVQVQGEDRLLVELPGITDVAEAVRMIGQTPILEFKEESDEPVTEPLLDLEGNDITSQITDEEGNPINLSALQGPTFRDTDLSGKQLSRAQVVFEQQGVGTPQVSLEFNDEGRKLFSDLTERNIGKRIAIFIDGVLISAPTVQQKIADGRAVITGDFTVDEARELSRNLNAGALPVPIVLVSQQNVGPTLGAESVNKSLFAGLIGLIAVAVFMIAFYRLPGFMAVVALVIYTVIILALFKLIPVTLTLAGVAGYILSIGIAVDANVLIFERLKEELRRGETFRFAVEKGFKDAWPSIRDSNFSSLITAIILYWFGTSIIRGFAVTLSIGIIISMFSAIVVTRTFLRMFVGTRLAEKPWWFGVEKKTATKKQ